MKKLGLVVSMLLVAVAQVEAANFEPAKSIENLNSQSAKETPSYSRMEGWVFLSYMVGKEGLPQDIELIASSNSDKYLQSSIRYLNNFRFSPATYQNEKV